MGCMGLCGGFHTVTDANVFQTHFTQCRIVSEPIPCGQGLGKGNFLFIFGRIKENFAFSFPFSEFILSDCESRMTNGKFLIDSLLQH